MASLTTALALLGPARPPPGPAAVNEPITGRIPESRDQQEAVQFVNDRLAKHAEAMKGVWPVWALIDRYERGDTLVPQNARLVYDEATRVVEETPSDEWHTALNLNFLRATIEIMLGKVMVTRQILEPGPGASDLSDALGAQAASALVRHWRDTCLRAVRREMARDAKYGIAFSRVSFQWDRGRRYRTPLGTLYEGDIEFLCPSPWDMAWDIGATDIDSAQWTIETLWATPDEIARWHPQAAHLIPADGYSGSVLREVGGEETVGQSAGARRGDVDGRLPYRMLFQRPTREREYGRYLVVVNDAVCLHDGELPYYRATISREGDRSKAIAIPHSAATFRRVGRQFVGDGLADLLPIQFELSAGISRVLDHERLFAYGRVILRNITAEKAAIAAAPGEVLELTDGQDFKVESPQHDIGGYQLPAAMREAMYGVSGFSAISQGQKPSDADTATRDVLQREADEIRQGTLSEAITDALQAQVIMGLHLAQRYFTIPRLLRTTGENGYAQAMMFKGSDVRGQTDIRMRDDQSVPAARTAKIEYLGKLQEYGFQTAEEGRELLGLPRDTPTATQRQMRREMLRSRAMQVLTSGEPEVVNGWDDHILAVEVGNELRDTLIYRRAWPTMRAALDAWIDAHREVVPAQTTPSLASERWLVAFAGAAQALASMRAAGSQPVAGGAGAQPLPGGPDGTPGPEAGQLQPRQIMARMMRPGAGVPVAGPMTPNLFA